MVVARVIRERVPAGYSWSWGLARGLEIGEKKEKWSAKWIPTVSTEWRDVYMAACARRGNSAVGNRDELILEQKVLVDATTAIYQL